MTQVLVIHGPNLNLLGRREPAIYGADDLETINQGLQAQALQAGATACCFQSNSESALIERIHAAADDDTGFIIINPGAFTHTSVALRDALLGVGIPFVEVHISNVHAREEFRQHSYLSDIAVGVISGLGVEGYRLALQFALNQSESAKAK